MSIFDTGRKRTEAALRESEQRMRAILETGVEGIVTIDGHCTEKCQRDHSRARVLRVMSIEDTISYQNDTPACVVCGKNVQGDRGFARINHGGIMVNLCCPNCMETFEKDPGPHMARLAKIENYRNLYGIKPRGRVS